MLLHGAVAIDRTPSRGARQLKEKIIPQRWSNAYKGLFFMVFVRHNKRHQHPEGYHQR